MNPEADIACQLQACVSHFMDPEPDMICMLLMCTTHFRYPEPDLHVTINLYILKQYNQLVSVTHAVLACQRYTQDNGYHINLLSSAIRKLKAADFCLSHVSFWTTRST